MAERWTSVRSFDEIVAFAGLQGDPHGIDIYSHEDGWKCGRIALDALSEFREAIEERLARFGFVEVTPSNAP